MATRLVILETPFAPSERNPNIDDNIRYARLCMRDSLMRGEAPIASHLLYTQPGVLDESERAQGIAAGHEWMRVAECVVVYTDRGISDGMQQGIERAKAERRTISFRSLGR